MINTSILLYGFALSRQCDIIIIVIIILYFYFLYQSYLYIQAAQNSESRQMHSPPPSYCSGTTRSIPRRSNNPVTVSRSRPDTTKTTTDAEATSTQPQAAVTAARGTTPDPRTLQFPQSLQSLDNIDLAIFGSVAGLADSSTAVNGVISRGTQTTDATTATSHSSDNNNKGLMLDVGSLFTGSRPSARLMTPRFLPRPHRGMVFSPTALLRVDEGTERDRGSIFTRL